MELNYLRTFKTITESSSFADAAEKLNYTRSTITFQVQQLEKEFGITLFEKIGKRMILTKAGKDILPYIESILSNYEQILIYGNKKTEKLRVAVPESLLTYRFQPIIQAFKEQMPLIDLEIQTESCYNMNQILLNDSADIAVHYDVGSGNRNIYTKKVANYPLTLFGSPVLSDSERDFSTSNQKKTFSFIDIEIDGLYRHSLDKILAEKRISLANDMVLGSIDAIIKCVKMGLGISVLPAFTVQSEIENGSLIRLQGDLTPDNISVMYSYHRNKKLTPAILCFLELAENLL